jgi:outer membrane immunogenic protein
MSCLRKTALTTAILLAWGGYAIAADAVVEEVVVVDTAYDWSGVYLGVQGGYGWADADFSIFTNPVTNFTVDADGPFVGGYAGYNFQWDRFVAGIEGDINASWIDEDDGVGDIDIDWFASIRGRVGYAWDRTLFFGTAGWAFAHADASAVLVAGTDNDVDFDGWTAGLGVEHAFTDNWLARAEYRHYDFGSEDILRGDVDLDMDTVSVGIAYKF